MHVRVALGCTTELIQPIHGIILAHPAKLQHVLSACKPLQAVSVGWSRIVAVHWHAVVSAACASPLDLEEALFVLVPACLQP